MPRASSPAPRTLRVGLPWWGMIWGLLAVFLGTAALQQFTLQPTHPVTFRIQEDLGLATPELEDLNITQETVDRAAEQFGLRTYAPLTVEVVDRPLTDEERGRTSAGETTEQDAVLITVGAPELLEQFALTPDTVTAVWSAEELSYPDHLQVSRDITATLQRNITAGHGPGAVVAAADTAASRLYPAPQPLPWAGAAAGALAMTFFSFLFWYRRRRRREEQVRTLATAQHRLARVLLDLEALEATYHSVDRERLPPTAQQLWDRLQTTLRRMLEQQPDLEDAVHRGEPVTEATAQYGQEAYPLDWFLDDAVELTALANSLMESISVHGGLAGSSRPLERLLAPVHASVRELETRLDAVLAQTPWTGPSGLSTADRTALSTALGEVLQSRNELLVLAADRGAAQTGSAPEDLLTSWRSAEQRLVDSASQISRRLRRREGKVIIHLRDVRHHAQQARSRRLAEHRASASTASSGVPAEQERIRLREALGLPTGGDERPLDVLEQANLVARVRLGDHPVLDAEAPPAPPTRPVQDGVPMQAVSAPTRKSRERRERRQGLRSGLLTAAGLLAVLALAGGAGAAAVQSQHHSRPFFDLVGEEQLAGLSIDDRTGDALELAETDLREHLIDRFTEPVHVTLAVRRLSDYTTHGPHPDYQDRIRMDYTDGIRTLWEVKSELPDLVDEQTGEMLPGQAVMPVMVLPEGGYVVMPPLTGTLSLGDTARLGAYDFLLTSPQVQGTDDGHLLTYEIEGISRALQANAVYQDQTRPEDVFWPVFAGTALTGLVLLQVLRWLGQVSSGLGRFGRQGRKLRDLARRADLLALDPDDSREFAVAVGETEEQTGQRLFERTLVLALREVQALRMVPRAERLTTEYAHHVDVLERRVRLLEHWDRDTSERTERLLAAARQRW